MTFTHLSCAWRDGLIPLFQMEVVMDLRLGGFGDRRLEIGGAICWRDWFRMERAGSGFGVWAVIGRARTAAADRALAHSPLSAFPGSVRRRRAALCDMRSSVYSLFDGRTRGRARLSPFGEAGAPCEGRALARSKGEVARRARSPPFRERPSAETAFRCVKDRPKAGVFSIRLMFHHIFRAVAFGRHLKEA